MRMPRAATFEGRSQASTGLPPESKSRPRTTVSPVPPQSTEISFSSPAILLSRMPSRPYQMTVTQTSPPLTRTMTASRMQVFSVVPDLLAAIRPVVVSPDPSSAAPGRPPASSCTLKVTRWLASLSEIRRQKHASSHWISPPSESRNRWADCVSYSRLNRPLSNTPSSYWYTVSCAARATGADATTRLRTIKRRIPGVFMFSSVS